jgi:hypothetical protein
MKALFTFSVAILLLANVSWSQTIQESHKKQYDEIGLFDIYHSGWAMVKKDKHLGFIDYEGKEVVPTIYDEIELFDMYHSGWAMVKKDKHLGFIDYEGKEIIPLEYRNADDAIKWYNNQKNK